MAMFHGKAGKAVWNAENGANDIDISNITSWTMDAVGDTAETTAMGVAGDWKTFLGGFKSGTGTIECNAEAAEPDVPYAQSWTGAYSKDGLGDELEIDAGGDQTTQKVFLELWFTQAAGSGLVYFPAIATGVALNVDSQDVGKVSYTFQINGEIFFKTSEPFCASNRLINTSCRI